MQQNNPRYFARVIRSVYEPLYESFMRKSEYFERMGYYGRALGSVKAVQMLSSGLDEQAQVRIAQRIDDLWGIIKTLDYAEMEAQMDEFREIINSSNRGRLTQIIFERVMARRTTLRIVKR